MHSLMRRMARAIFFSIAFVLIGALTWSPPVALAEESSKTNASSDTTPTTGGLTGDTVYAAVTTEAVSSSGSVVAGGGEISLPSVEVDPVCYYRWVGTGQQVAEKLNGPAAPEGVPPVVAHQYDKLRWTDLRIYEGYEQYSSDSAGDWYEPYCDRSRAPEGMDFDKYAMDWRIAHPTSFFPAGSAPVAEVDPQVLARAVWRSVRLPAPVVDYNPKMASPAGATIVGMDTWLWATDEVPKTISITATAGSTSVTVTARASRLLVDTEDGDVDCTGFGIPWVPGAPEGSSDCTVVFTRSSARRQGGATPVDVSVSYAASYTASDGTSGELGRASTRSQALIPVAEVQAVNVTPTG